MNTIFSKSKPTSIKAFSYLEITIVVVMLIIVAGIVAPQRLIQMDGRSYVSRVKSDHRSLATGLEAYYVDNNEYPAMATGAWGANAQFNPQSGAYHVCTFRLRNSGEQTTMIKTLTTPIAYITSHFPDPFADTRGSFFAYRQFRFTWLLISYGPDRDENTTISDHYNTVANVDVTSGGIDLNFEPTFNLNIAQPSLEYLGTAKSRGSGQALHYDPSNGTTSEGDIVRVKG